MRIYLNLERNNKIVPYNYQNLLTGVIHKWLGKDNSEHGQAGVLSFSWLQNTKATNEGINLNDDAYFFISAWDDGIIKKIVSGILDDPTMFCGIKVNGVQIANAPKFKDSNIFLMASPVLLKWRDNGVLRYVTIEDEDFEEKLNINFKNKLQRAGLDTNGVTIAIDPDSTYRQTKMVIYNGIKNRASLVPIVIEGTTEQITFAWSVGLGNSTGIGFGALK